MLPSYMEAHDINTTSNGRLSKAAMHRRRKTPRTEDGSALSGFVDASSPMAVLLRSHVTRLELNGSSGHGSTGEARCYHDSHVSLWGAMVI